MPNAQERLRHTTSAMQSFINCKGLVERVYASCDMGDLQKLASVSRGLADYVRDYVKHRVICIGAEYFRSGAALFDMLRSCDAVVSGSTALHLLMPEEGTTWIPSDLDIYLPQQTLPMMTWHVFWWSVMAKGLSIWCSPEHRPR